MLESAGNANITDNISCLLPYEITEDQWTFYFNCSSFLKGFASLFIGLAGIVLNVLSSFIILESVLAGSFFNWILVCLSIFNILFLCNSAFEGLKSLLGSIEFYDVLFVRFLFPLKSIVMCCSIYTTIFLAWERHDTFKMRVPNYPNPRRKRNLKTYFLWYRLRIIKFVGPILIFATVFYIPKWFELRLKPRLDFCSINKTLTKCGTDQLTIELSGVRNNHHYIFWYLNVANMFITALGPLLILAYLNINIYINLKRFIKKKTSAVVLPNYNQAPNSRQARNMKMKRKCEIDLIRQTTVLFVMVIFFFLSHVLRIALNIEEFESLYHVKEAEEKGCAWLRYWTILAVPVSNLLLQINSSMSFLIYCIFNKTFRKALKAKLSRANHTLPTKIEMSKNRS